MSQTRKRMPFREFLFIDLLYDRTARSIWVYTVAVVLLGAVIYHQLEGWDWLDSIYFVVITITTIGYGDLVPTKDITKLITIFYSLNGVILLLTMFDVVRRLRQWGDVTHHTAKESTNQ